MKKCLVFHIDRTIVDSFGPELTSFQEAYQMVTGKRITDDDSLKFTTLPTDKFFKLLNLTDEETDLVNQKWNETFIKYKTICFPGIKEVIHTLAGEGYMMGIITSRTISEFHELDDILSDIREYFKVVVTSDKIHHPKPDAESMNYLCQKLNITCDDVIYIGDSKIDEVFAKNANVSFIPACWESKELLNNPTACINVSDLPMIINSENKKWRK